jgi:2-alkyl-3-oxoalkanoate reductase
VRVLVTGATGFLGRRVAERFAADGHAVTASGRNRETGAALRREGVAFAAAELGDAEAIDALVAGADAVVHCGGLSSVWGTARAFAAANVGGTRNVASAALRHGARLVHISTPSIYFDFTDRFDVREDAPLPRVPANGYAASKRAAEALVRRAGAAGLDAIVLRPRAIFGPRDTALLPRLARIARGGRLPLIDGGRALADLTYVDNVVDAVDAALHVPPARGVRTYNLTNGEPRPLRALFGRIAGALELNARLVDVPYALAYAAAAAMECAAALRPGRPEPRLTRYTVGVLGRSQTLDIGAARRELGYAPRVSLDEAIERTAAWWRTARA